MLIAAQSYPNSPVGNWKVTVKLRDLANKRLLSEPCGGSDYFQSVPLRGPRAARSRGKSPLKSLAYWLSSPYVALLQRHESKGLPGDKGCQGRFHVSLIKGDENAQA